MDIDTDPALPQLLACAVEAGDALAAIKKTKRVHAFKKQNELVTDADQLSHEILYKSLSGKFPGVTLVMEEQSYELDIPSTCIVVDELDGTVVYSYGGVDWGVTCALIENSKPVAAVIYLPDRHTTVMSSAGGGTWINGKKIALPKQIPINESVFMVEINPFLKMEDFEYIKRLANITLGSRALACSTASIADLLLGRGHIYLNIRGGKIWDFAAGALAVDEAGGVSRLANGEAIAWHQRDFGVMMLSNRSLLDDIQLTK